MARSATIRDVASTAGVSIAVVSRVINPGSGPVRAETRDRVLAAIEQLAYRPRTAARELKQTGAATTLGLVLADVTNPFFARLADRVVWEARSRGVQVLLMTTQEDPHLEEEALATLVSRRVGGVIATPTATNPDSWTRLRQLDTNVVFVDRSLDDVPGAHTVSIDNVRSARQATGHLIDLGHRRIGFISGPESSSTGRARTAGHRAVLAERGLEQDEALVRHVPFRGEQGGDAVGALLALPEPPTALVVANTAQVVAALRRLRLRGTAVPADLSVVVFDDDPWTELFEPALTIIRQPIAMLAAHSVELALAEQASTADPRRIAVEAEFVPRGSTTAP